MHRRLRNRYEISEEELEEMFADTGNDSDCSSSDEPAVDDIFMAEIKAAQSKDILKEEEPETTTDIDSGFTGTSLLDIKTDSTEFTKIQWEKKAMPFHVNAFKGNTKLPTPITDLKTPLDIFTYFFTNDIMEIISIATNNAAQKAGDTDFETNTDELREYMGILIYMSVYQLPKLQWYWGEYALNAIKETMPFSRFMAIKKHLAFDAENTNATNDSLFGISKLANKMNELFDSIPKTGRLCVEKKICNMKFQQNTPNDCESDLKLFVLCDPYGYTYRFEIYDDAADNIVLPNTPDLGNRANVVVRLSQTIPDFAYHTLCFDNYLTTLPLLVYLRARGIYSLGAIKTKRIPNCKWSTERDLKGKKTGAVEYVATAFGVDISNVFCKGFQSILVASNYVGVEPFQSQGGGSKDKVDMPHISREYNAHVAGLERMFEMIELHHINAKPRNTMEKLFYNLLDMAILNAYNLHGRINAQLNQCDEPLKWWEFRQKIATGLVTYKQRTSESPSSNTSEPAISGDDHPDDVCF